ncbi:MAG TPA: metalloregulator ArsR/SmtB family transcription factor [Anaerolineales bacterium]|nr:metalloregulator ArsR/SmtB family transcription factor [Anaerolineales bacterium]
MPALPTPLENELHELHAGLCSALADPKRLMILYALDEAPQSVGDLTTQLGLHQSTTSRHLKILRDHGLVTTQRLGPNVIYSLNDPRLIDALDLLRMVMRDVYDRAAAVVNRSA